MSEKPDSTEGDETAQDAGSSEITLPDDIIGEIKHITTQFSGSADSAISAEYEKIGALQFLRRVPIDESRDFKRDNAPVSSLSASPVRDEHGDVVAYDYYRKNQNAIEENPDAMQRIARLSIKFQEQITTESLRILEEAVRQGRALDLGEMPLGDWAALPDEVLDEAVEIHLCDEAGIFLKRVRVFRILS